MPKPHSITLESIELTNGEFGTVASAVNFLDYLKTESITAPIPDSELNHIMARYILHERREQMDRISKLRVSRGESPLPKRLVRKK